MTKTGRNVDCPACKKRFYAPGWRLRRNPALCCSVKCSGIKKSKTGQYAGENNPSWKGGIANDKGYLIFSKEGKYIRRHRHIMEQILGRPLLSTETIHHKNGIITDNRPENLQILSCSEHTKLHAKRKLSDANIAEIKRLRGTVTNVELGKRFGVSAHRCSEIQLGKWKKPTVHL